MKSTEGKLEKSSGKDIEVSEVSETTAIEGNIPDELGFFACVCPCQCGTPSTVPASLTTVLARYARCASCAVPIHMEANPLPKIATAIEDGGPITRVHQVTKEEGDANRAAQAEVRQDIWDIQWAKWNASLPEKFQGAHTEHPQILERLTRIGTGKTGRGVASAVAIGNTGVGKTYLAVAYANQAIKSGYFKPSEVLFGSEAELLSSAANAPYADVEKAFTRLTSKRYKMIIVDDVGRGTYLRDDMRPKIWSLILDSLYSDNRVVVITTNLPSKNLAEYIGEGAMDRLRAMVGYGVILLDEPQRRKITEEMLATVRETSSAEKA